MHTNGHGSTATEKRLFLCTARSASPFLFSLFADFIQMPNENATHRNDLDTFHPNYLFASFGRLNRHYAVSTKWVHFFGFRLLLGLALKKEKKARTAWCVRQRTPQLKVPGIEEKESAVVSSSAALSTYSRHRRTQSSKLRQKQREMGEWGDFVYVWGRKRPKC